MRTSKSIKAALAGALALGLVVGGVSTANAANIPAGSTEEFHIFSVDTEEIIADNAPIGWTDYVAGYPTNPGTTVAYDQYFTGPAAATGVYVFVAPRGQERDTSKWLGRQMNAFSGDPANKKVLTPALLLNNLAGANYAAVRANGGDFSAGLAFTSGNGVTVEDVSFAHITVKPGGEWSYVATVAEGGSGEPTNPSTSGDIDLEAETVVVPDGSLSLSVPAGAKATFSTATIVGGKSTSVASLPEVTVTDERYVSKKGWTLTQTVADFISGSNVIAKANLGVAPKVNPTGTTSTGITPAAAQSAGSAVFPAPFADAAAGAGTGVTKLGADLTLVAPVDAPAGTYTSKMTLTLVSK